MHMPVMWSCVIMFNHQVRDQRPSEEFAIGWGTIYAQFRPADRCTSIDAQSAASTTPSDAVKHCDPLTLPQMMELATARKTLAPISKDEEIVSQLLTRFILPALQERDELQRENAQLKKTAAKQAAQMLKIELHRMRVAHATPLPLGCVPPPPSLPRMRMCARMHQNTDHSPAIPDGHLAEVQGRVAEITWG